MPAPISKQLVRALRLSLEVFPRRSQSDTQGFMENAKRVLDRHHRGSAAASGADGGSSGGQQKRGMPRGRHKSFNRCKSAIGIARPDTHTKGGGRAGSKLAANLFPPTATVHKESWQAARCVGIGSGRRRGSLGNGTAISCRQVCAAFLVWRSAEVECQAGKAPLRGRGRLGSVAKAARIGPRACACRLIVPRHSPRRRSARG